MSKLPLNFSPEPTAARASVCARGARFAARWLRLCSVSGGRGSALCSACHALE